MVFEGYKQEKPETASISATPLSKKLLDNIDVLDSILTDVEKDIIDVLKESPATTQLLRVKYIFKLTDRYKIKLSVPKEDAKNSLQKQKEPPFIIFMPNLSKSGEKLLKQRGFKIPSYHTLDNMLFSLENLGIVARRYDPLKKGKWLWILNPNFSIALKEKKP